MCTTGVFDYLFGNMKRLSCDLSAPKMVTNSRVRKEFYKMYQSLISKVVFDNSSLSEFVVFYSKGIQSTVSVRLSTSTCVC